MIARQQQLTCRGRIFITFVLNDFSKRLNNFSQKGDLTFRELPVLKTPY